MSQEPFLSLPVDIASTMPSVAVPAHVVTPSVVQEEPARQDPTDNDAMDMGEQPQTDNVPEEQASQEPQPENVPNEEAPRRSQRARKSAIPADYELYNTEEYHMEDDPTSYEEAMRSAHSSKWLEAMKDEMRSMHLNDVWDLEEIPK